LNFFLVLWGLVSNCGGAESNYDSSERGNKTQSSNLSPVKEENETNASCIQSNFLVHPIKCVN